ncbi:MAG: hypothetical protein HRT68_15775 [Flavobacteriaceae bacterium]|nr:hypothetical protein [Flavobacteriaceae bacterium]
MNKNTQKKVIKSSARVVGATGGAMLSRGLLNLAPIEDNTTKSIVKGGVGLAAMVGSAFIDDKTTGMAFVKGSIEGMAIQQIVDGISGFFAPKIDIPTNPEGTDKFLAGIFGLGCPCVGDNGNTVPRLETARAVTLSSLGITRGTRIQKRSFPLNPAVNSGNTKSLRRL